MFEYVSVFYFMYLLSMGNQKWALDYAKMMSTPSVKWKKKSLN